jgi:hypothetical protein
LLIKKDKPGVPYRWIHINIFDLLDGRYGMTWHSVAALRAYSNANELIFPRDAAKSQGLRAFLRVFRGRK